MALSDIMIRLGLNAGEYFAEINKITKSNNKLKSKLKAVGKSLGATFKELAKEVKQVETKHKKLEESFNATNIAGKRLAKSLGNAQMRIGALGVKVGLLTIANRKLTKSQETVVNKQKRSAEAIRTYVKSLRAQIKALSLANGRLVTSGAKLNKQLGEQKKKTTLLAREVRKLTRAKNQHKKVTDKLEATIKKLNERITKLNKRISDSAVRTKKAAKTTLTFRRSMGKLNQGIGRAASSVRNFAYILDSVFIYKVKEAIEAYGEFDSAVRKGAGLLPVSQQNLKQFGDEFDRLALKFGKEPTEQAEAFYKAISNRLGPDEALAALPLVNRVAIATQSDLADVMKAGTDVVNAMGLEISALPKIYNSMANAIRTGQLTMSEFNTKLGDILPAAVGAGIGLDELLALFSEITIRGKNPARALTQLNRLIIGVVAPSSDAAAAFAHFGIDASKARIEADGFGAVLKDLLVQTTGNVARLKEFLPNIRALLPALSLMEDNLKGIGRTTDEQRENTTALANAYKANFGSAEISINRLKAAVAVATKKMGRDYLDMGMRVSGGNKDLESLAESLMLIINRVGLYGQTLFAMLYTSQAPWILGLKAARYHLKAIYYGLILMWKVMKEGSILAAKSIAKLFLYLPKIILGTISTVIKGVEGLSNFFGVTTTVITSKALSQIETAQQKINDLIDLDTGRWEETSKAQTALIKANDEELKSLKATLDGVSESWSSLNDNAQRFYNESLKSEIKLSNKTLERHMAAGTFEVARFNKKKAQAKAINKLERKSFKERVQETERLQQLQQKVIDDEKANVKHRVLMRRVEAKKQKAFIDRLKEISKLVEKRRKEKERADKAEAKRLDKLTKQREKHEKDRLKAIEKQQKAWEKAIKAEEKRAKQDKKLRDKAPKLTMESTDLKDIDAGRLAETLNLNFRNRSYAFVNEDLKIIRKMYGTGFRYMFQATEAAIIKRKNEIRNATDKATDGIVEGLQKLADQISPVVAQITYESEKAGRDAMRRSRAALRSSMFYNPLGGSLSLQQVIDFEHGTGAWAGYNKGGEVKRYAAGGMTSTLPNTDSVPALLTPGEFVINREASSSFLPLLQRINRTSSGRVSNDNRSYAQNNTFNFSGGSISPDQVRREIIPVIRNQERMGRK